MAVPARCRRRAARPTRLDRASDAKPRSEPLAGRTRKALNGPRDLPVSPGFHAGTGFFLTDLYGARDLSKGVDEVRRIVPAMVRVLPASALETIADAFELDALTEDLDAALVGAPGLHDDSISAAAYAAACRKVGRRDD